MHRICCVAIVLAGSMVLAGEPKRVDFTRDVKPILSEHCFKCHGPDAGTRKAELRLDLKAEALRPRDGGPAIVAGKPEASPLIARVTSTDESERMPPPETGKTLTPAQIETLRRWISEGAEWKEHWAYLPPQRPAVPSSGPTDGESQNEIDVFIRRTLNDQQLRPSAETDRITLIRRLSFDLIGLPPTPDEVRAFVADTRADAYELLVDRLLASPQYGERMAVYWLDVVRYADTTGIHSDNHRNVDLFRDYVIRAFNQNLPFDRFVVEQIAGDLLPTPTADQRIASGYNKLLMTTVEGGAQPKEYTAKYSADRVRNTATAFLGSTMGCCECHDHKYDPFLARDFYRFAAFFADVKELATGYQEETLFPMPDEEQRLQAMEERAKALKQEAASDASKKPALAEAEKQLDAVKKDVRKTLVSVSVAPRMVRVLPRGNWLDETGEAVQAGIPAFLQTTSSNGPATRLDLANWLVARDNPLTARVFVNRLWKLCFGQGLVKSLDDFGSQGTPPSHPELLDWLTVDFIDHGWDVKRTLRLIVTSATYRQTSQADPELRQRDPDNRWLARQGRFRLDAEHVRDNALAVSGLLATRFYGRSVRPYQPPGFWSHMNFPTREYEVDSGDNLYRRGLYTYWCRTFLHPSLAAFDAPTREESCVERPRSNTPLQSLVLLNDPIYVEAARAFAARILHESGTSDSERLTHAFELALSRKPRWDEAAVLLPLLEKHRRHFAGNAKARDALLAVGQAPVLPRLDRTELAAWTSLARAILNLHETIGRF